jgi:hypothetical protein
MISTSPLSTALSKEHSADLRRAATAPRAVRSKRANPRLRLIAIAVAAVGIALFASAPAWAGAAAQTVYASPTGVSLGTCVDPSQPCLLQTAISQARAGAEVVLEPGTYTSTQAPITVTKPLDIHGEYDQPAPTIVNDHSTCATGDLNCSGQATIRLGGSSGSLRHVRVLATSAQGGGPDAIEAYNPPDSDSETLEDVYAESVDGVAIYTQGDVLVRDTAAWTPSSSWAAIEAAAPAVTAPHAQVRLENVTAIGGPNARGVWVYANCIVDGCGVDLNSENSIMRGGTGDVYPSGAFNGGFSVRVSHSNYDATNVYIQDTGGQQTAQPQFVDATGGDFRELETSPTRDAGIASSDLGPVSLGGGARTYGSAPDIGAYEWTPAPPVQQQPQPQQPQGGSQPTGPSTTSTALTFHGVGLARGTLRAHHGKVRVRVSCPKQAARYCKGTLTLRASHARFTLKPGQSKHVSVSLASKLRKLRRFNATVMARARDAHGQSFSTSAKVRVKSR